MQTRLLLVLLLTVTSATAAIVSKPVEYREGDTALSGWSVCDDQGPAKRPAVLVVHQWMGLTDYEKRRAEMLAKMGYNVLAADIYGQGVRPKNASEAGALAGKFKNDRALLRARVQAALETLRKDPRTDSARMAAIGYCFGGTTVLELARSGADLAGVVSFHGGLAAGEADTKPIKAKVLALHGADDPHVPPKEVAAFEEEMRKAGADWQFVAYGGAVHSFTDWKAGSDNSKGAAYNERADHRSWEAMKQFFAEILR